MKGKFTDTEFCEMVARCQVAREYWDSDRRVKSAVGYGLWAGGVDHDGVSVEACGIESLDDPKRSGPSWVITVWIVYGSHWSVTRKEMLTGWEERVLAFFDKTEPDKRIEEIKTRDGEDIHTKGVVLTLPVYNTWELVKKDG